MAHTFDRVTLGLKGLVVGFPTPTLLLDRVLGHGAFGTVYLGVDIRSKSSPPVSYAVKCLPYTTRKDIWRGREEFEHHSTASASNHPGIVKIHQAFVAVVEQADILCLVLDHCSDGNLSRQIHMGRFENRPSLIKNVIIQILEALQDLHSQGIYHCDIKAENILCSGNRVMLSDFGLSSTGEMTSVRKRGTMAYMSPEVLGCYEPLQEYSSETADTWALGILLCHLIAGKLPWDVADVHSSNDGLFALFTETSSLRDIYPSMTDDTAKILSAVFRANPMERLGLEEIRLAVLDIPYFTEERPRSDSCLPIRSHIGRRFALSDSKDDVKEDNSTVYYDTSKLAGREQVSMGGSVPTTDAYLSANQSSQSSGATTNTGTTGPDTPQVHAVMNNPKVFNATSPVLDLEDDMPVLDIGRNYIQGCVSRRLDEHNEAVRKLAKGRHMAPGTASDVPPPRRRRLVVVNA